SNTLGNEESLVEEKGVCPVRYNIILGFEKRQR
ncbi:unnamed protein product, partial [marine sediment metagenome]